MILNQIVAVDENCGIGKDNKLLWHFPEDLKFFKAMTSGKIIIMGRKTYDSILSFSGKPLPNRFHIVLSRTPSNKTEQVQFTPSIEEAYAIANQLIKENKFTEDVFIIGGAEIYKLTLNDCHNLYITKVQGNYNADTFYPDSYNSSFILTSKHKSETTPQLTFEKWTKSR